MYMLYIFCVQVPCIDGQGTAHCSSSNGRKEHRGSEEEEEEGEGDREEGEIKWIHEFVKSNLPGSRHQVSNISCTYQRVGRLSM